ncbi:Uridine kinase, partial [Ascosphaera atra]
LRDVQDRGRKVDGILEQWFKFVKPSYQRYIEPQRMDADIIVRRGRENTTAIDMVVKHIQRILQEKSHAHEQELRRLGKLVEEEPLSKNVIMMERTPQVEGMNTILQDSMTEQVDFVFYFNRLAGVLITSALDLAGYDPATVHTPTSHPYSGLHLRGTVSAVSVLRGGSCLETALRRIIPETLIGRVLIQTNYRTG